MRKALAAVAWMVVGIGAVPSTVVAMPMVECRGCTRAAQEEAVALATPGTGVRFVYNFQNHSVRKFWVDFEQGLPRRFVVDAIPVEPQPAIGARVQAPSGPTWRRLYEMSVDPDVFVLFHEMDAFNSAYSNAWSNRFRIDIGSLGQTDSGTGMVEFDPQRIAWEYPGGEGLRFRDRVDARLNDPAAAVDARLARYVHGVLALARSAHVESASFGFPDELQISGAATEFSIEFCNRDGYCTAVKSLLKPNGLRSDYLGSFDPRDVELPGMGEARRLRREWSRSGLEQAKSMARFIADRTGGSWKVEGGMNCAYVNLVCVGDLRSACTVRCP